ncbi:hypothetical protein F5Y00DRAFT_40608 [Daldinia vernicosa]|uniref:uncharacterized protein n=1 Tax=Daldinia vernicosa TaxID=114800 RepID=UPI002008E19C|nr:uncharacterized protein F5Y00DRAFT_40608 [Daldinia vernicosa]KAI0850110.1 hypothetical protein F5Y00DRAFT_40608 [Daldinia vernicosa]
MAEASILRFPISGKESDKYFLLAVSSNGSRVLDLKLVGSESTAVFTMKLRHKRVGDYKASSGPCSHEEWEEILVSTLVNQQPVPDIEIRADVDSDGTSVSISFRKNIQGITQRLGSIKLEEDEKTEISPFDWCISALGAREKVGEDLAAANLKIKSLEDSLAELKDQLDELIKAKDEDETQLLEKFRDLINEKKVKIRQQQRLLASASIDPEKLANVNGFQITRKHVPESSRASKRKAKEEEESSDDGFEKMDVEEGDNENAQADVEEDHGDTTAGETASGADTDEEPVPPPVKSQRKGATKSTRNTRASTSEENSQSEASQEESKPLPPPRSLPFMKNKKPVAPAQKPADDQETESDDEL